MADIKTLNGYNLADTQAREDIAALSKEIEELKEGGGGGSTSNAITKTGRMVLVETSAGTQIIIEAQTSEAVTLNHTGRNMMPNINKTITSKGTTFTPNDDGTVTISGIPTGNAYGDVYKQADNFFLPAGTYHLIPVNFPTNELGDAPVKFAVSAVDGSVSAVVFKNTSATLEVTEGKYFTAFYTVTTTFSGEATTCAVMFGPTVTADSPFEKANVSRSTVTFPTNVDALEGTNIFYTSTGEMLTVSYGNSVDEVVDERIAAALKFDASAWGLPTLHLTGDTSTMTKDVSVDLAYVYTDTAHEINRSGTASVKWQGSSSVRYPKKNYTVKFDNAFEAVEGWGAQKKYCMKANWIDFSHARNVVNAKLWGQIVKSRSTVPDVFANLVNAGAVDGFPIIITLNGEFHGLYTFNIPKDGWMMNMGSGTNECILCAGNDCATNRFKAAATLEGENDLEIEYITNEDDTAWAKTSVNNLISACINSNGSDLDTTIASMLDWQSAIDYYIFTVLLDGHDMTTKNYLLVTFDGTKWYFSGYDMDCTYGLYWDGSRWLPTDNHPTFASYAEMHRAMELIKLHKKDALKARYAQLRASVLSESNVATTFGNFIGQIPKPVYMEDVKKWKVIPNSSTNDINQIRDYYRMRVALADKWIEAL